MNIIMADDHKHAFQEVHQHLAKLIRENDPSEVSKEDYYQMMNELYEEMETLIILN